MTREDLLQQLRDCQKLADHELAIARARESINDYVDEHGPIWNRNQNCADEDVIFEFRKVMRLGGGE